MTWRVVLDDMVGRSGLQGGSCWMTGWAVQGYRAGRSGLQGGTFGMTGSIVKDDGSIVKDDGSIVKDDREHS